MFLHKEEIIKYKKLNFPFHSLFFVCCSNFFQFSSIMEFNLKHKGYFIIIIKLMFVILLIIILLRSCKNSNEKAIAIMDDLKNIYMREQDVDDIDIKEEGAYTFVYNKGGLDIMYCQGRRFELWPIILVNFTSDNQARFYYERVTNLSNGPVFLSELIFEKDSVISIVELDSSKTIIGHDRYTFNNNLILKEKVKDNFFNK